MMSQSHDRRPIKIVERRPQCMEDPSLSTFRPFTSNALFFRGFSNNRRTYSGLLRIGD